MKSSTASRVFAALALVRRSLFVATLACCVAMLWANTAPAAVSYDTTGSSYTQNFDTLPNTPTNVSLGNSPTGWTDDNASPGAGNFSILGWYLYHTTSQTEGGFNGHQRFRNGSGSSTTGSFYSFGANSSTERALGDVGANTLSPDGGNLFFGLRLTNNTSQTLTGFTLSFDGEQWRNSGVGTAETMNFGYSLTADSTTWGTTGTFTSVPSLSWTAPVHTTTAGAVDGNSAGKVTVNPVTVKNISWAAGTDLWLRWADPQPSVTDDGLAIDNVSFSANIFPVPAWTGATSTDWGNGLNWNPNGMPGSGDTVLFNGTGNNNTTIGLGASPRAIGTIQFSSASAAAYTLGSSSSEQLDVDAGGAITVANDVTSPQIINAKINALGALTLANSSTSAKLTIGSAVTNNSSLIVDGAGTIDLNGTIGGTGAVTSTSTGTIEINAQNTYSGNTSIVTAVQNVIRPSVSSVGNPGSITSGPFGKGTVSISGATAPIFQPVGSDITVANDFNLTAGFFAATGPAAVDPTVRSLTFTGNVTPVGGSRVITNNIAAGGTLTFGSAGSPSTIALAANGLTLQTQQGISGVGGGRIIVNDLITGSAAVTASQLTVQNGVTVVLNNANTYTGLTTVQIGTGGVGSPTLLVNNTTGSGTGTGQVNVKTGFLGGTGTIAPTAPVTGTIPGQVTIGTAGVLAPGSGGIGTLTFDGSASANGPLLDFVTGGSSMLVELNNSHQSDKVSVSGAALNDLVFNGTPVNFTDLTSGSTLASGNYTLFATDLAGAYMGLGFDITDPTLITSGLTIGTGLGAYANTSLHLANGGKDIVLTIPAATIAGDYNSDGKVDAADYVIWRKGGSPNPNSQTDYDTWRANFGTGAGSGAGSGALANGASVPEPASVLLVLMGLAALVGWRRVSR